MLRYGIPNYRLPPGVLDAEIDRIARLGVEIQLDTAVGSDVSLAELRARHAALYVAIGAQSSRGLGIVGDADEAVWNGAEFLLRVNRGDPVEVGATVAVIGGGNTAVDAARTARRAGADVTIVYRRSREEMPAIVAEVEEALAEGVALLLLSAPVRVERRDGSLVLTVVRMELGEPDESGRRRPVALAGAESELPVDTVIAAVSQEPAWSGLEELQRDGWLAPDSTGAITDGVWGGGDAIELGICGTAIAHGRRAAEALQARLRGLPEPPPESRPPIGPTDCGSTPTFRPRVPSLPTSPQTTRSACPTPRSASASTRSSSSRKRAAASRAVPVSAASSAGCSAPYCRTSGSPIPPRGRTSRFRSTTAWSAASASRSARADSSR